MSDCNHEKIKCMKCHRYVGISDQVVPTAEAVKRIQELEEEVRVLKANLKIEEKLNSDLTTRNTRPPMRKGYPGGLLRGNQHDFA